MSDDIVCAGCGAPGTRHVAWLDCVGYLKIGRDGARNEVKDLQSRLDRLANEKLRPLTCTKHTWSFEDDCPFCNAEALRAALLTSQKLENQLVERVAAAESRLDKVAAAVTALTELSWQDYDERQGQRIRDVCATLVERQCQVNDWCVIADSHAGACRDIHEKDTRNSVPEVTATRDYADFRQETE